MGVLRTMSSAFSFARFWAVLIKEFVQMRRDRLTFAMMIGVPVMQLLLFGYAINADPKALPTAVVSAESGMICEKPRPKSVAEPSVRTSGDRRPVFASFTRTPAHARLFS